MEKAAGRDSIFSELLSSMGGHFHAGSLRYAVALWLATVLALFTAFVVQLEPAQWTAITVWIMFMQDPRLNFSKVIWWVFGTVVGALVAVILIALFNQTPELFIVSLAAWLAICSAISTFVVSYRAYGWVLAGYTCAIVSMTSAEHPDLVFKFAATRVSCIFIGMASAIVLILVMLPKHGHWKETLHHLREHLKASLKQASRALGADAEHQPAFTWRHMVDRLSTLELTLDATTAETSDSRIHAKQARSLVATLFTLLARAQSIEAHLTRRGSGPLPDEVQELLASAGKLLSTIPEKIVLDQSPDEVADFCAEIETLKMELDSTRANNSNPLNPDAVSTCFVLNRLEEMLDDLALALNDWVGLFGKWPTRRPSRLKSHKDTRTAFIYGIRMFLAVTLAGVLWGVTQWPSGTQLILFISVVCSLLSLVEYAPYMGWAFVKSAVFCFIGAYIVTFKFWENGNHPLVLMLGLGAFLMPAGYAYRSPRLIGSAVVSMLIFYGLSMPANQMDYNVSAFLNNGFALVCAACCGFFAFHAVPSLTPSTKQRNLLRAVRNDLAHPPQEYGVLAEQAWSSLMFDRLRLLHRAKLADQGPDFFRRENEILLSLQLGLRQRRLRQLSASSLLPDEAGVLITRSLHNFRKIKKEPKSVLASVNSAFVRLQKSATRNLGERSSAYLSTMAELSEMALLLESSSPFYQEKVRYNVQRN